MKTCGYVVNENEKSAGAEAGWGGGRRRIRRRGGGFEGSAYAYKEVN